MRKIIAAAMVAFSFAVVALPAQAGVITGDFVCNPYVEVVNVVDYNGVITGDLLILPGTDLETSVVCENGAHITNISHSETNVVGVITGD